MTTTPQSGGKKGAGGHASRAITRQRRLDERHKRRDSRSDLKALAANNGHTGSSEEIDAIDLGPKDDGNVADPDDKSDDDGCF